MRTLAQVALVAALALPANGQAQMSEALGKPLPDANLPVGTITVRVVDGDPAKPMSGLTVEIESADAKKLAARTNPQGRVSFKDLTPGASYTAKVSVEGGQGDAVELATEPFSIPDAGGLRFMLSPKPLSTESSEAPAAAAPKMDPRRASGIPRPQQGDPPGRLTVRAIAGDLASGKVPAGLAIHLIGYGADGSVSKQSKGVDDAGRAVFDGLSTSGQTVYYALTLFERNGVIDRVTSQPITMIPQAGSRLMLAGLGEGSGQPAIDDLASREGLPAAPPGQVMVRVGGREAESLGELELVEVGRPDVVAKAVVQPPTPQPEEVRGVAREPQPMPEQKEAVRVVVTQIVDRGPGRPVAGAAVRLFDAANGELVSESVSGADGRLEIAELGPASGGERSFRVEVEVHGKKLQSKLFAPAKSGGLLLAFDVAWNATGMQAVFEGVQGGDGRVYLARVKFGGQVFRTAPFQLTPTSGASVSLLVYSGLIFAFHGGGEVDDENFWFQNQYTLYNPGNQPYLPPTGAVEIPLPAGFRNPQVGDEMSSFVKPTATGVVWRGPLAPGATSFLVSFAIPVKDGALSYDLPLPMGAYRSRLVLRRTPGIRLLDAQGNPPVEKLGNDGTTFQTLAGVPLTESTDNEGRPLLVLSNLNVPVNQRFSLRIEGLPMRDSWWSWARYGVGALVLMLVAWGFIGLWVGRHGPSQSSASELGERREELLDRIVALESDGGGASEQIEQLKAELVAVQRQVEAARANDGRD